METLNHFSSLPGRLLLTVFALSLPLHAQTLDKSTSTRQRTENRDRFSLLDLNDLPVWLRADGVSGHTPGDKPGIRTYGGQVTLAYQDGMVWGAKAYTDSARTQPAPFGQLLRVDGITWAHQNYPPGTQAGRIVGFGATAVPADSLAPEARVYRIRRDYASLPEPELRREAANFFEIPPDSVTAGQIATIRARYDADWREWPVQFGAPFIDRNGNGVYDDPPPFSGQFTAADLAAGGYDEPGIAPADPAQPADQVLWTVFNDLDSTRTTRFAGSLPLGLEVQVTEWQFKNPAAWGKYFYRRVRLINKGGARVDDGGATGNFWLDAMYFGLWADVDLGQYSDDLVGCDTTLDLGYVYNGEAADREFKAAGQAPGSAGYLLLQGPRVPAAGHTALFDGRIIPHQRNLPMTAFVYQASGDGYSEPAGHDYDYATVIWYRLLRGFAPFNFSQEFYYVAPPGQAPGPFRLAGDPVAGTGDIDGLGTEYALIPGERRLQVNTGPFRMAPGDTQDIVLAFVFGQGSDRLASVSVMKHVARLVRSSYPAPPVLTSTTTPLQPSEPPVNYVLQANYPNPFNGGTRIGFALPVETAAKLAIYNLLGRELVVLLDQKKAAGEYSVVWEATDGAGRPVPAGVYIYRLQAGDVSLSRKLTVVR